MKTIVEFLQSLIIPAPIAPEVIRAKAHELWKSQGGGQIDPDANWQAAIEQLQLAEKLSRRNYFRWFDLISQLFPRRKSTDYRTIYPLDRATGKSNRND
jgi:hypothetical protein